MENDDLNNNNDNIDISEQCITSDSNFINSISGNLIRNHLYGEMSMRYISYAKYRCERN